MGEVYRARDTRLGRTVAIKVLPERLSQEPELRQRLEHEARTISKLSHPNICTLHDIGHQDGIDFLVLELLKGRHCANCSFPEISRSARSFRSPFRLPKDWPRPTTRASPTGT